VRVLVGCEYSGVVRRAFAARGHDAWSCDLLPASDGSNQHLIGDVRDFLTGGWDLLAVFHPPCTRLCNSGVRWLKEPPRNPPRDCSPEELASWPDMSREEKLEVMWRHLDVGAALFSDLWNAPVKRICVENPVMNPHARERIRNFQRPAQTVQPWWFGDPAFKATGLYLRGLPALKATRRLTPPRPGTAEHKTWSAIHRAPPGPNRWAFRSTTFPGVAEAMADQWGGEG
jgi:hypothetical protein